MRDTRGKAVFYGVDNINSKMDSVIDNFNLKERHFEVKLLMSEALTNAFIHGNKSDNTKPIYVEWDIDEKNLTLTVTDSGVGTETLQVNKTFDDENILEEHGRGLFIIDCYADEVNFRGNSIIMKKYIS